MPSGPPSAKESGGFSKVLGQVGSGAVRVLASTCAGTGVGSGFLLDDRTVLTALPAVARAASVVVVVGGRPIPAQVQSASRSVGFASLRLSRSVPGHEFRYASGSVEVGGSVAVVGVPVNGKVSLRTARVAGTKATTSGNRVSLKGLLELTGSVDAGLNGAPVVDRRGRVAGMVVTPRGEGAVKAIPAAALDTLDGGDTPERVDCANPKGPQGGVRVSGDAPAEIRGTLGRFFTGVNRLDLDQVYGQVQSGVLPGSRTQVTKGFRSSYVFNVRIRASQGPNAWVTFDSIFAQGSGPRARLTCARWSRVYVFSESSGSTRISRVEDYEGDPAYRSC